ncbi:PTS sugar transporter subunit IIA [Marispirochaeta sp.]|jgi:fructose-specific phosphotransferase system IIA component|uniref:PTS sugar transporter subunit IIA n=1 Tax=Marispirochaeta sp. TaxID=2038653 RepID=UPI0029C7BE78|nr:PTS sugar transporter subunit IIA [Marispirochaeta sp.]
MAINISELLNPACIELDLAAKKKPDIIKELASVLARGGGVEDQDKLYKELMKREKMTSTGIGSGIAIPHCLSSQVQEMHVAFGRKLEGAKFDAVDNQPVSLFFLLAGPEGGHSRHLQVLSRLARYLHDPGFCNELLAAAAPEEVIAAFTRKEEE